MLTILIIIKNPFDVITYVVDNALKLIKHKMDPHLLNTNTIVKMEMCKGRRLTLNSTF